MIYGVTGMWGANKLGIIKYRIKNKKKENNLISITKQTINIIIIKLNH